MFQFKSDVFIRTLPNMSLLKAVTAVVASLATLSSAVDIVVQSSGGNKTSEMPYGLMHEVSLLRAPVSYC